MQRGLRSVQGVWKRQCQDPIGVHQHAPQLCTLCSVQGADSQQRGCPEMLWGPGPAWLRDSPLQPKPLICPTVTSSGSDSPVHTLGRHVPALYLCQAVPQAGDQERGQPLGPPAHHHLTVGRQASPPPCREPGRAGEGGRKASWR